MRWKAELSESPTRVNCNICAILTVSMPEYPEYLCDRTVTFQDTTKAIKVISVELAEKSPYFATLLRYSDIQEPISLPAFLAEPFNSILEFIRVGYVELNETNVIETLLAADFLQLKGLRSQCVEKLQQLLTQNIEFACDVWLHGCQFHIANLNEIAFDVLTENFESLRTTGAFLSLPFDKVCELLSHDLLNVNDEKVVLQAGLEWLKANPEFKDKSDQVLSTCRLGIMSQQEVHSMAHYDAYFYGTKFHHLLQNWPLGLNNLCMLDLNLEKVMAPRVPHQAIFMFGGLSKAAVQVYDEKTNTWRLWSDAEPRHPAAGTGEGSTNNSINNPICNIPIRTFAGCITVGDNVFLIGGRGRMEVVKTTLCFDFSSPEQGWQERSCMYERRSRVKVAYLDGFIYAIGGYNDKDLGPLGSAERYSVEDNTWHMIASMNHIRGNAGAAAVAGRVYVCGGFDEHRIHNSVECYNPLMNEWTLVQSMNDPRSGLAVIEHQGAIYAVGGYNGNDVICLKTLERYDVALNTWTVCGEMTHSRSNFNHSIMGEQLYIIGGWSGDVSFAGVTSRVERYNLVTGECSSGQTIAFFPSGTCACSVRGRKNVHMHLTRMPGQSESTTTRPVPSLLFTGTGYSTEPSDHGEGSASHAVASLQTPQIHQEVLQQEQVESIADEIFLS